MHAFYREFDGECILTIITVSQIILVGLSYFIINLLIYLIIYFVFYIFIYG